MKFLAKLFCVFNKQPEKQLEQYVLTEWYLPEIKPVHIGLYEVKHEQGDWTHFTMSYWDGIDWCDRFDIDKQLWIQDWQWRGIKK